MAILPHLKIGKLREFYSDEVSRTWMSAIKGSNLIAHDGESLSHKGGTQDYLDKNKYLYAKVLKGSSDVLDAARQHDPNIDAEITRLENTRVLENKSVNQGGELVNYKATSTVDSPSSQTVRADSVDLIVTEDQSREPKKAKGVLKWVATTALVGAMGAAGFLYNEDQNERESLSMLFEDTAYSAIQPSSPVEKCVLDRTVDVAVDAVRDAGHVSEKEFTRHVWPNFKNAVYAVSDECGLEHGNGAFNLDKGEIAALAVSLHGVMKNNL